MEAYRDTEIRLAQADAQLKSRLVRTVFDDHSANPARLVKALRTLGMPANGPFAVAAVEAVDSLPVSGRLISTLKERGIRSVWDPQVDSQAGLLFGRSASVIDRATADIADFAHGHRVGLSTTFNAANLIHSAVSEARLAWLSAPPGSNKAIHFGDAPVAHLVVTLPEAGARAARQILDPVLKLGQPEQKDLLDALAMWFHCSSSTTAVADVLRCHRNTVRYRLRKVRDLTARDTTNPLESAELYVALTAVALLGVDGGSTWLTPEPDKNAVGGS